MAATALPVKHVIDARVALEVQRCRHTRMSRWRPSPAVRVFRPTDFGKFFTRHIDACAGTFHHIHQGQ
ncbi:MULTISPECIES: hypothetical protein [unclassified Streptomyces]|uniref:hypothetical protein n=1 Tax=unclassified Streptomyces TaxID=2593676 RepID=UPI00386D787F